MPEMGREIVIESLGLNVRIPDFSMRNVNLSKLSKVLRRKGLDIDIIREGQRIDIPIVATKENYTVLMNPLENWITVEAEALNDAIDGWKSISQILLRVFRIFKVSKYILDVSLRIKCKNERAGDKIGKVTEIIKDSLNLNKIIDENVKITGFKITTSNLTVIVDEWDVDPSYYFLRIVKESENLEDVSKFNVEDFADKLINLIEGLS